MPITSPPKHKVLVSSKSGFGLVEIVVGIGIFLIIATGGVTAILQSQVANRLSEQENIAATYAKEGLEAVKSIKNQDFSNISAGTFGLSSTGNLWSFSGSSDSQNGYTRQISISQGRRSGGAIVDSGGTIDNDFFKVVSTVSWNFSPTRNNDVSLTTYLSNFKKAVITNWASITAVGPLNLANNNNAFKVASVGNYAYVVRQGGSSNFAVINVSNPASPTTAGALTLTGTLTNVFVSGTRAYVTSTNNNGELYIIDISNPTSPALLGTYNASGSQDGNDIFVNGTSGYFVRSSGGSQEFVVLNLSNPAAISVTGSLNLNGTAREVAIIGNYAYVASTDNNQELQVVSIANPASPSLAGVYNASGSNDALTVAAFNNTVLLGDIKGLFMVISTTNPASPSLLGSVNVGNDINDIALDNSNTYAFLATDLNTNEFRVISISTPASPSIATGANLNNTAEGVAYNPDLNRVFVVSSDNNVEFIAIQPN